MKALNIKERRRAQWTVVLFFVPMLAAVTAGMLLHFKVVSLQIGDLDEKEVIYDEIFRAQARKGEVAFKLDQKLEELRLPGKNFMEHQILQKEINQLLREMQAIVPATPDTSLTQVPDFPGIYDSLATSIVLTQNSWDTIKVCDETIKRLDFELDECTKALSERLAENKPSTP
jgi:hypothetical protein